MSNNQSPQIPELYTNSAECYITPYDFLIRFGLTDENGAKPQLNVRMSPLHMKIFADMLDKNIAEYEKKMGEIIVPKNIQ